MARDGGKISHHSKQAIMRLTRLQDLLAMSESMLAIWHDSEHGICGSKIVLLLLGWGRGR